MKIFFLELYILFKPCFQIQNYFVIFKDKSLSLSQSKKKIKAKWRKTKEKNTNHTCNWRNVGAISRHAIIHLFSQKSLSYPTVADVAYKPVGAPPPWWSRFSLHAGFAASGSFEQQQLGSVRKQKGFQLLAGTSTWGWRQQKQTTLL